MKLSCRYIILFCCLLQNNFNNIYYGIYWWFSVHTNLSNKTIQVLAVDICVNCLVLHKITIVQEMLNLLEIWHFLLMFYIWTPPPVKYLNHLVECKLCITCVTWKSVIKDMHVRTWPWITCTSGGEMLDLNHWHVDILVDDFMTAENIDFEKCRFQQNVTSWYLHVAEVLKWM